LTWTTWTSMDYTQEANYKLFLGVNGTLSNRQTPLSTTYHKEILDLKTASPTFIFPKSSEPNNSTIIKSFESLKNTRGVPPCRCQNFSTSWVSSDYQV
jgi:hypothetical protein